MRTLWLEPRGRPSALVCFAGWAMDDRPFRRLTSAEFDVLICYDYRDLATAHQEKALQEVNAYACQTVVAWSLGCAAAEHIMPHLGWTPGQAVAINGTVTPEDEEEGIPAQWITLTAAHLTEGGWEKFVRRMCSDVEARHDFEAHASRRRLDEAVSELEALRRLKPATTCGFTRALVGNRDRIILPANQQRCWERRGVPFRNIPAPHYPFHLWRTWDELLAAAENDTPRPPIRGQAAG